MRLAQRQVWRFLADRAQGIDRADAGSRPAKSAAGRAGYAANDQDGYPPPAAGLQRDDMPPPKFPPASDLPSRLAKPAQRALSSAGIHNLTDLCRFTESEISRLHGIGPNALELLRRALAEMGLSFKLAGLNQVWQLKLHLRNH